MAWYLVKHWDIFICYHTQGHIV